jgi:hypothetical protein
VFAVRQIQSSHRLSRNACIPQRSAQNEKPGIHGLFSDVSANSRGSARDVDFFIGVIHNNFVFRFNF